MIGDERITVGWPIDREQTHRQDDRRLEDRPRSRAEGISALTDAHLLQALPTDSSRVRLTDSGQELHATLRADIDETIGQLYRNVPFDDRATAGRVLCDVTARPTLDSPSSRERIVSVESAVEPRILPAKRFANTAVVGRACSGSRVDGA
jgi:hypothetical protein